MNERKIIYAFVPVVGLLAIIGGSIFSPVVVSAAEDPAFSQGVILVAEESNIEIPVSDTESVSIEVDEDKNEIKINGVSYNLEEFKKSPVFSLRFHDIVKSTGDSTVQLTHTNQEPIFNFFNLNQEELHKIQSLGVSLREYAEANEFSVTGLEQVIEQMFLDNWQELYESNVLSLEAYSKLVDNIDQLIQFRLDARSGNNLIELVDTNSILVG